MKFRVFLIIFAALFLFVKTAFADSGYTILNYDSNISIEKTGEVRVIEDIKVNFLEYRHGIYRDIPFVYEDENGNKTYTKIDVSSVLQDGQNADIKKSNDGNYLRIRIGDADKTIIGEHVYKITYRATGVLLPFSEYDELYWNVTGNLWDTEIASATAAISTPTNAIQTASCYQGDTYSTETCNAIIESESKASFATTRLLPSYQGMTIAAGLQKGVFPILIVERPKTFLENFFSFPSQATLIVALIAGISTVIYLWFKFGRDSWMPGISGMTGGGREEVKPIGAHEPVVVEFTPPEKLTPALIGLIVDEKADTLDVTATIIDLASRGYLTITEIPKKWIFGSTDYLLKETGKDHGKLLSYEKELLTRLFTNKEVKTSELKMTFYDDLAKVKTKLYEEAIERKYFESNPEKIRTKYLVIGILALVAGVFSSVFSATSNFIYGVDIGIAAIVVGFIVIIFSQFMPRRTAKGRELYRRIKGYKQFIERAETYKQKFFEDKNTFTDVLPYTIVFGLTAKFAKAMKDIGLKPQNPSWYHGVHAFNVANFSSDVSSFSSSMSHAIASSPSSSGSGGGGFSGGGFGGGGGGSW